MANLASVVWQDGAVSLLLGLHSGLAPSDAEWDHYCSLIPGVLAHANAGCMVLTDGGAPTRRQRDQLRKQLGSEARWTAVITDKALVRGVVTAIRWFNPQVCAFAPWESPQAFKFIGVSGAQIRSICAALKELDGVLTPRSRVLPLALQHIDLDRISEAG